MGAALRVGTEAGEESGTGGVKRLKKLDSLFGRVVEVSTG
jgi:hypothetical protein